ncbi:MAG: arylsulfatase A-like enzyme, partial [Gammaproteobacteria bacterium]
MRLVYFDPGPKGHYHPGEPRYNQYLRELGYTGENPWDEWANAAAGDDGEVLSAWLMKYASRPTRLPEEHTETPYMTRRAMEFVEQQGQEPWCLHLSYIKPHWPYIVSAPYHEMYCAEQVTPVLRSNAERESPHPIYAAYMQHRPGRAFSQPGVREAVIPAYMGLISQIDDQLGLLFEFLQAKGQFDNTMIVFTSDHGDYLGDHWLGDKDFMHDAAVKIPMIVVDPSAAADKTRGSVNAA